jgi:hypothetical protein
MKESLLEICLSLIRQWGWATYPWPQHMCESQSVDYVAMISFFPNKEALAKEFISHFIHPIPLQKETFKDDLFDMIISCIETINPHRRMVLEMVLESTPLAQKVLFQQLMSLFAKSLPCGLSQKTLDICSVLITGLYLRALTAWCHLSLDTVMSITDQWITQLVPFFSRLIQEESSPL